MLENPDDAHDGQGAKFEHTLAEELKTVLSARGFTLTIRPSETPDGRPGVVIGPIPEATARRLLAVIGPVPAPPSAPEEKEPFAHVLQAIAELNAALFRAGIVLPSVRVDVAAAASGVPLVELGRARPDVVRSLALVITKGAGSSDWPAG
ncbi:hypothetical protein [Streptomyces sp. NPDC003077]|uniref:hypothetical protein n=1 Tax=Streptomyces sp. NPDC003077 TaxID=3154443 RepID=UPI0033A1A48B